MLIPRPIRISLRNTFRRKTRLALTLFTLVLGGAVFIGVYNLWASFDKSMEEIQGYFLADINISFGSCLPLRQGGGDGRERPRRGQVWKAG